MKRQILSIIIVFFFAGYSFGQYENSDSLVLRSYNRALERFYDTIAPALFDKLSNKPIVRFVPEFSLFAGGSVISIDEDTLGKFKLIANTYSFRTCLLCARKIEIIESSNYISREFTALIVKLFDTAISQISEMENPSLGLDGFTYYFLSSGSNGSQKLAEIWSPNKGLKIYKIVPIINDLIAISEGHQENIKIVTKKINRIINESNE